MKRIEIEQCFECKYASHYSCVHPKGRSLRFENKLKIPDWCPLPDVGGDYTCPECDKTYNSLQMAVSCCYKGDGLTPIE